MSLMTKVIAERGYYAIYREHEVNHCPGCDRTHWYVGRQLAECAFCGTALPLDIGSIRFATPRPTIVKNRLKEPKLEAA